MNGEIHHIRKKLKDKQIQKILELEPGRELDALVAEYVMGLAVEQWEGDGVPIDYWYRPHTAIKMMGEQPPERVANYSTVLFAGMQIVSHYDYWTLQGQSDPNGIHASLKNEGDKDVWVRGCSSIPEAICKAALLHLVENGTFIDKLLEDES